MRRKYRFNIMETKTTRHEKIRYIVVECECPIFGGITDEYRFEVFKRPYFFGLLGRKKWDFAIMSENFNLGFSFCLHLLGDE